MTNSKNSDSVEEMMNDSTIVAQEECFDLMLKEADGVVQANDLSLGSKDQFKREVFEVDDNVLLTVELGDFEESDTVLKAAARAASGGDSIGIPSGSLQRVDYIPYRTVYKNYGNRYFTASYTFAYPAGWVKIITENHYNISSSGLVARYGVTAHKFEGAIGSFKENWRITDRNAASNGTDINIVGTVQYALNTNIGVGKGPYHLRLDTRVRLDKLDKANKRAKVTEHAYFYRTKTLI